MQSLSLDLGACMIVQSFRRPRIRFPNMEARCLRTQRNGPSHVSRSSLKEPNTWSWAISCEGIFLPIRLPQMWPALHHTAFPHSPVRHRHPIRRAACCGSQGCSARGCLAIASHQVTSDSHHPAFVALPSRFTATPRSCYTGSWHHMGESL
jgi:hypothetical protein